MKQKGEEKRRAIKKKKCTTDERESRDSIQCHRKLTSLASIFQMCFLKIPMKSQMNYKCVKEEVFKPSPKRVRARC